MANVLIVTIPVTGHVSPMLPIAKMLVNRQHNVNWYTGSQFRSKVEAVGATFQCYRTARDIDYHNVDALYPERAKLKGLAQAKFDMKHLMIDLGMEHARDIDIILDENPTDIIIGDAFSFGAQFAAKARKLPYVALNITNIGFPSRDTAPDGLGLPPNNSGIGRLRNRFLNWLLDLILLRDVNQYLTAAQTLLNFDPVVRSILSMPVHADLFLQPTIADFEYPRHDLPDHVYFLGALLPTWSREFTEPEWWHLLHDGRTVVLVTQGTIATNPEELLIPAIRGLANEDMLVIATSGKRLQSIFSESDLPNNVIIEPFIPFDCLLPHVDVMITNGGYGGVHFALTHGVPLVAAGTSEDKAEICSRIAWSGVGINLKTGSPTPLQIKTAVQNILTNSSFKLRSEFMQSKFAQLNAPLRAAELIESLVGHTNEVKDEMDL